MSVVVSEEPTPGKQIVYIADPMCSWCWGFAPVISALAAEFGEAAPFRLVVGGLRAGETRAMDDRAKQYIRHHWHQVHETTGQPFDFGFFDREGFVYDTEPPCRAAVSVRNLAPEMTFGFFETVQRAFYVEGLDVTDRDTLAALAGTIGIDSPSFAALFDAPEVAAATRADFLFAQTLWITGFPAVLLKDDAGYALLTIGYRPLGMLHHQIDLWMRA